jgi:cob(I)alamin adenosyltransferase
VSIATKTGDDGTTGLFGGGRVSKDHPRVAAYGAVDELNAALGVVRAERPPADLDAALARAQSELFDLGAELATPRDGNPFADKVAPFGDGPIAGLDEALAALEPTVPALKTFILPGGTRLAAQLHVARTVCRRAERDVVALEHVEPVPASARVYLNRLSDVLFTMARVVNARTGTPEPAWRPQGSR